MRPPRTEPPSTQYTVPCPWSVPRVPFSRKVRPNSEITATTVLLHADPICSANTASPWPRLPSRFESWPCAFPSLTCVSQPPTSMNARLNLSRMSPAMRRDSSSNPRALIALRLAACISLLGPPEAIISACSATVLRSSKPSLIRCSKRVPAYMPARTAICRSSNGARAVPLSETLGTTTSPVITTGNPSVNATGAAAPPSEAASRFMKPDPNGRGPAPALAGGSPASTRSCVSKWLRLMSSAPAKVTKAAWPACQSG